MAKDFFGNEYPTYAERLALARAAKMCLEAGRMTPEALSLLDGAADDRLYTFLLNHGSSSIAALCWRRNSESWALLCAPFSRTIGT